MRPLRNVPVGRRGFLQACGGLAILAAVPAHGAGRSLPDIPVMASLLAGRTVAWERLHLTLPRLADNGFAVPLKLVVDGPFETGAQVRTIHLFSETNPVPGMAVFEFAAPLARVEVETRIRLAGTQHIVALATLADDTLLADAVEVIVTLAGCMDGT